MSTSVDTMKTFFNVLKLYAYDTETSGITILDHAIQTTTHFAGLQDAVNHFIQDIANVTATAGVTQSLLQNCGIVIGEFGDFKVDTGSVSGYYAGMGVVKDAQTIVPEPNVDLSQLATPAEGSTTTHTYTGADGQTFSFNIVYPQSYLTAVNWTTLQALINQSEEEGEDDDNGSAPSESETLNQIHTAVAQTSVSLLEPNTFGDENVTVTNEQVITGIQLVTKGMENFWYSEAVKLAYDSFGLDFNGKTINVFFAVNDTALANTLPANLSRTPSDNIIMFIDMNSYSNIVQSDPNGNAFILGGSMQVYLDRTIAHEMIHGTMSANGVLKDEMPEFFTEGIAELVHGASDFSSGSTDNIIELASDSERLTNALVFKSGTGTQDAYPAGYMFLRYLCNQSLPTQLSIGTGTAPELFAYTGGEEIISGAADGSQGNFASGIGLIDLAANENDMFVFTTAGNLIVRDARGKLYNAADESGNVIGRGYLATDAGTIDGRIFGEYEFICGANNEDNEIYAGNGGAKLWGGSYGNDNLFGGAGADEFVTGVGCGSDVINNADSNDVINLAATTLEQITGINATSSGIEMTFSDGSSLNIVGSQNTNFTLADNSAYTYNYGTWTKTA